MAHLDRLSTLISHVEIKSEQPTSLADSNLALLGPKAAPERLLLFRDGVVDDRSATPLNVRIDIGGPANPLFQALPPIVEVDLTADPALLGLAELIRTESETPRCGGAFALDRLCELLVVNILRHQIENTSAEPGLFAGLAHPKLNRVLVAMHDAPGRHWRVDDFLSIAGMSRSQFMSEFQKTVGLTPIAYLKQWRMVLARAAVLRGDRVNRVAHRFGYASSDAFCRAFASFHGVAPTKLRERGAAH